MVVDTSAVAAILQDEPERRVFLEALEGADQRRISAANWVESSILIESRYGLAGLQDLDRLLRRAVVEIAAVDAAQARLALEAFSRFGKGRHPAGLNFGDCFAYALAMSRDEPL
ncbi:MAG: type II toxin-antitoxin system VapC family toxin, partial [Terriglobales bacterium]